MNYNNAREGGEDTHIGRKAEAVSLRKTSCLTFGEDEVVSDGCFSVESGGNIAKLMGMV